MSHQSWPQALKRNRIQPEINHDSCAPTLRQHETSSSRIRLFCLRRTPQDDGVTKRDGSRRNTSTMQSSQKKENILHRSVDTTSVFPSVMVTHACTVSPVEASVCGAQRGTNSSPCHFLCATMHSRPFSTLALRRARPKATNSGSKAYVCQTGNVQEGNNDCWLRLDTRAPFLVRFLSFCTARDTCFAPHDAAIRHFRPVVPDGKGCGRRLRRQHESRELIPNP